MGIKLHMVLQGLLVFAQPMAEPLIAAIGLAPEWARVVNTALGAGNLLLAYLGHQSNPDGTPATVAFVKPT